MTILADSYQGKHLNSPNDLVYRSDGSLYFTDPPYGIRRQDKLLSVNGIYRAPGAVNQKLGAPPMRAQLQLLADDLNAHLRSMGIMTGGPSAHSKNDRSKFASMLDAAVNKLAREGASR